MTTDEVLAELCELDSKRTFCATKESFRGENREFKLFRVSVQPGYDGSACQMFDHSDGFDNPLAEMKLAITPVSATENLE